ncbi:MAG: hypothetical protein UX07_C0002G0032 [Parcubacteria group bacterium GW2011_GWA2_45_30]|nr:MAG: hypothetical protein UX07_C0002G0032 [Parcubacteria group bacterium GW2011_GWA2_45_30]
MAQRVAKDLGLPLSTVINAYLKQFIRSREVYISAVPRMTSALEELVGRAEKDLRKGKNISPIFSSAVDAIRHLNS